MSKVAYWLAVNKDGEVEFGLSTNDANRGEMARDLVNQYINGFDERDGECCALVGVSLVENRA